MKIEIAKEINSNGNTWYRVYVDGSYTHSCDTEKGAKVFIEKFKQNLVQTKEIIYTETI